MLIDAIFLNQETLATPPAIEILSQVDIGERVICVNCNVNGAPAKRLTQETYGRQVTKAPVWSVKDSIVSDQFGEILETEYQKIK